MIRDEKELFDIFEERSLDNVEEDKHTIEYNKYMVIINKGTYYEEICDVYDVEFEALRRLREEKSKKTKCVSVIKADITYVYISGVKFIDKYKEIE